MPQNDQPSLPDEDETGLEGLAVHAPADPEKLTATRPYVEVDPLAADRAQRIADIRAEAAAKEAEAAKAGKPIVERPQAPASLLAAAEERAAAEARAASPFKISSNAQDVLPTKEEILARRQAEFARTAPDGAPTPNALAGPVDVQTDERYAGKTWEEVVAIRQEEARIRRHNKELAERESNQQKKEEFRERILAARRPETTVHRAQPIAPAISAQTLAEMEAGRKRSEEFGKQRGAVVLPRVR